MINALDVAALRANLLGQIPMYSAPPAAGVFGATPIRREGLFAVVP